MPVHFVAQSTDNALSYTDRALVGLVVLLWLVGIPIICGADHEEERA